MNKWHGTIGFSTTEETSPGVWEEVIVEKNYYGEIIKNNSRFVNQQDSTNDNVTINNELSILADPYIHENLRRIRYVSFMGVKWKVTSISVEYPRLKLTLGG